MEITIDCENDKGEVIACLSNELLNNLNFVDLIIGDNVYTISLNDLIAAVGAFRSLRKTDKEIG
jgi:hypothetical protein